MHFCGHLVVQERLVKMDTIGYGNRLVVLGVNEEGRGRLGRDLQLVGIFRDKRL